MVGQGTLETLCEEEIDEFNHVLTTHNYTATKSSFVRAFSKAIIRGMKVFTRPNQRLKKRNSHTVLYQSVSGSSKYGLIEKFFTVDGHHMAVTQCTISLSKMYYLIT